MKDVFDGLVEHLLNGGLFLQQAIEILEKSMIQGALRNNQGNQCAAAKQLGIHRNTLQRKMVAYEVNATRSHMGMAPLDHERVYSYVGNGAPVLIRRALGAEASEQQVQEALEFFLEYYREHYLDYTTLYPGVREALDRLRDAGKHMAVLTNKPVRISKAIIDGLGVGPHFFQVYGGNSFDFKKPHPIGIETLMKEAGVP